MGLRDKQQISLLVLKLETVELLSVASCHSRVSAYEPVTMAEHVSVMFPSDRSGMFRG